LKGIIILGAVFYLSMAADAHADGILRFGHSGANPGSRWQISPGPIFKTVNGKYLLALGSSNPSQKIISYVDIEFDSYADASAFAKDINNGAEIECDVKFDVTNSQMICQLNRVERHSPVH
jgi:hypothetical protein